MTAVAPSIPEHRLFGLRITQLTARRIENFRRNQRGYYSLIGLVDSTIAGNSPPDVT